MSDMADKEIESTFVIASEEPERLIAQITGFSTLGEYKLVPGPSKKIHDIYLDTFQRELGALKVGFRIRELNGEWKIALKCPRLPTESGVGVERTEIEETWGSESLAYICEELSNRGIELLRQRSGIEVKQPVETLLAFGFIIVQDRDTYRQLINVVSGIEAQSEVLVEIAIDETIFHFSHGDVRHFEIEIEAKQSVVVPIRSDVHNKMQRELGVELMDWKHGKLPTGFAIEKLLETSALASNLRSDGSIDPIGYMIIENFLGENPSF